MDKNVRELENLIKESGSYSAELDAYAVNPATAACKISNAGYIKPSPSENSHLETEGMALDSFEITKACHTSEGNALSARSAAYNASRMQLSKLSPHLARVKELEGENQRLKHDVKVLQDYNTEVIQNAGKVMEQAVQVERERIYKEFYKWTNPKVCNSDFSEMFAIALKKLIPLVRQALQK